MGGDGIQHRKNNLLAIYLSKAMRKKREKNKKYYNRLSILVFEMWIFS